MKTILILTLLVCLTTLVACATPAVTETDTFQTASASTTLSSIDLTEATVSSNEETSLTYPIVDTGQTHCYDNRASIACPEEGEAFFGQDAQISGTAASYQDNGDGTVTDLVTGLIWAASPDLNGDGIINADDKLTYAEAQDYAETFDLAGYADWRLPTIKELYSLMNFNGTDPSGIQGDDTSGLTPFIDTEYFEFAYGDTDAGERIIDAQMVSSTLYTSTTMGGNTTMFGVNFADGRIKGYPVDKLFYVYYVRGNSDYGVNNFVDNGDGTVSDLASGLMWAQEDSGVGMDWESVLAWVEQLNADNYLGYSDWRLPNAKELQSIVDYSLSPDATGTAALAPIFEITAITNEAGQTDYAMFWSSTTHINTSQQSGSQAVYIAFGRAMGNMFNDWLDVHGAGAQRSDPKTGNASDYPKGHGPQGDAIRIENFVRVVRDEG